VTDRSTDRQVVQALLMCHGRTFAAEAGIRLRRNTPAPLFQLLCLSLLVSARISASVAVSASRALTSAGWTTPRAMAASSWEERTRVLNRSGYARYDESTSRYLAATAERVLDEYGGDLRRLRSSVGGDRSSAVEHLRGFTGIGQVGSEVFLREVQLAWPEFVPFTDDRSLDSARRLGLPAEPTALRRLVDDDAAFTQLVAALVRAGLAHDHDAILAEAARR
jgi:endonuclease III